jgi:peptidyl-tRNA hydrolase
MKDYRLYVLMRNDLASMSPGRCMAQANHAASVLEHSFGPKSKCPRKELQDWKMQTRQGFGTCIVLAASLAQIENIFNIGELKNWILKGWVIDPEYGSSHP